MYRSHNILFGAILLIASGCCLASCQEDDLGGSTPDREELIEQGMYLTARSEDAFLLMSDTEEPRQFQAGTPYRLLAFAKPYNSTDGTTVARFNKVAWEGATASGLHFINIDSDPTKWFGFTALPGETGGTDGLVSLDFYGFTYGLPVPDDQRNDNYIPITDWKGATTSIDDITRTETVTNDKLNDLMRGELLDQNIATAGVESTDPDGYQNPTLHAQSVMKFNHCFSKLRFQVSQQENEQVLDANGKPTKLFKDLYVEKIEVTNTYKNGTVYLKDGKVQVDTPTKRSLTCKGGCEVTLNNTEAGEMIIFPTDGASLKNEELSAGYIVGLNITVRSSVRNDIKSMLINTGTESEANVDDAITKTTDEATGTTWYYGTIKKDRIVDYYDKKNTNAPLYLKQNNAYMFIIFFQNDFVRIVTAIPQVEEWLPGEGTPKDPWQDQEIGQPQMFDNIVWSDRNLGSNYYNPTDEDYELTVGYFYQPGRNIPYFPFKWENYNTKDPTVPDIYTQDLANSNTAYNGTVFQFFPIVDRRIRKMNSVTDGKWTMNRDIWGDYDTVPQMDIPELCPTNTSFFNFLRGRDNGNSGLKDTDNMYWDLDRGNQPVHGSWRIPSSKDFLTIFPSTNYAGNITFRVGSHLKEPMGWNPNAMSEDIKVLRVTVPYYDTVDCEKPKKTNPSAMYTKAWNTLRDNNDPGCTLQGYNLPPGGVDSWNNPNPNYEPDGDPGDGYASAYIISREGDDLYAPEILKKKDISGKDWKVTSWGTIYAIKRIYTPGAYRMRWRVLNASKVAINPCFYVEICRYQCKSTDKLTVENYKTYDWDHPAATLYFPICGLGDWTGKYINFGTECQYATSDPIKNGTTSSVQIKVTGNDAYNCYIGVVTGVINRNFGTQIRPVLVGTGGGLITY